ncbi:ABC transporter permease [Microbacteriaceae bacterium VKM Ac-2854]|nr:ABC transporter permease [Microbacteriaceae bacterium VKM Ac-2854]
MTTLETVRPQSLPFFRGVALILGLELRQRVRGVSSYVLLGLFFVLVGLVTALVVIATGVLSGSGATPGGWLYSIVIYFVLLLTGLVTPALSGNAINGDRDAGTLATTQVTLVSTAQLVIGKFLAAWVTALVFLGSTVPFLLVAVLVGGVGAATAVVSMLVLALELGVTAAVGVGLSGIVNRPLMSVVTSYLVIAALSLGSLIAFGLLTMVTTSTVTTSYTSSDPTVAEDYCDSASYESQVPRADYYWGLLAVNPFVVLADAAPARFDEWGGAADTFSGISLLVRQAQQTPELDVVYDCAKMVDFNPRKSSQEIMATTVPSWFVGLSVHILLGAGALWWAITRTSTPAARLPRGNRVA